jgi:RNA polymerase sigma-70 factor (ECF subfamily)
MDKPPASERKSEELLPADSAVSTDATPSHRRLYAIALAILHDQGEAEEAVQETMEFAWRSRSSLRSEGSRAAWLTRICVRQSLCRRRRWFRSGKPDGGEAATEVFVPFQPRDLDLHRAYGRLSAKQRAVVSLHYGHGYTLDECAALMRSRPGTVRSHLARALTALREELQDGRS